MVEQSWLKKFQELYAQKAGKVISDADALEYFEALIRLVEAIYE